MVAADQVRPTVTESVDSAHVPLDLVKKIEQQTVALNPTFREPPEYDAHRLTPSLDRYNQLGNAEHV
jgi:hypothetical protein